MSEDPFRHPFLTGHPSDPRQWSDPVLAENYWRLLQGTQVGLDYLASEMNRRMQQRQADRMELMNSSMAIMTEQGVQAGLKANEIAEDVKAMTRRIELLTWAVVALTIAAVLVALATLLNGSS
jgi:hypothetical protein